MDEKLFIALCPEKIKVLVVGGGRAAYIKSKTFVEKGAEIFIISKDFSTDFKEFKGMKNICIKKTDYSSKYIINKHIVVIATDDSRLNSTVREDCRSFAKICIDCSKPSLGNAITPCQRNTKNVYFGVNIKGKSPKTAVFAADKMKKFIYAYDDFIEYTSKLREKITAKDCRRNVMNFVCTDDFYFFYKKKKAETVIRMFYDM